MDEIDSDTEPIKFDKIIKNPINQKYEKLIEQIDIYIINTKDKSINEILSYIICTFFEIFQKIGARKLDYLKNKLSMLFHKMHQLSFFNLLIKYCQFIKRIISNINSVNSEDIIFKGIYDIYLNQNLEHKFFSLRITTKSELKFEILKKKIEEIIYNNIDPYAEYNMTPGPFPDGYEIIINLRDDYLILNDEENEKELIQDMKDLFKKYGINEKYINWWKNNSYARQVQNYDITEEKEKENNINNNANKIEVIDRKKNEEIIKLIIEQKKEKFNGIIKSLKKQEINIKNNFKLTNKNFSHFRESFKNLKHIILSIVSLKNKIKDIYPYGSISQLTQNINSDYEISLITENYSNIELSEIEIILKEISSLLENNYKNEYKINGIRKTRRTYLLLITDKSLDINIEINCNNIFSILNSNLIYKYITYDARVLILINTIKDWSKIKGINSNHEGYMSSYCYTLMTIFFLQRIKKPLLPIINSKINYNPIIINKKEYFLEKNLLQPELIFKNFKTKNKEDTITTLLLKFFVFYLYLFNERDYCIDISNNKVTFRYNDAKYLNYFDEKNKISVYCIIDMFDYTYNPGSYMDRNSTPHKLYIKKLKKSLIQLLNGEDNLLKPDFGIEGNNEL